MADQSIPGLVEVQSPLIRKTPPGQVSDSDLDRALRFDSSWERVPIEGTALEAVLQVQEQCQFYANTNRNKDLVGVFSNDVAAVGPVLTDNQHPNPVSAGVTLIFVNKKTRKIVKADAAGRFGKVHHHGSTAFGLIQAAIPDER